MLGVIDVSDTLTVSVSVQEHVPDVADGIACSRLPLRPDGVHANEHAEAPGALSAKPRLEAWMCNQR
jgi:hypothetical protein